MKGIGKRIKTLRGKKFSQAALAAAVGVTPGAVGQWELDINNPSYDNLGKIAKVLGVDVIDLLAKDGQTFQEVITENPQLLADEIETIKQERSLTAADVQQIVTGVVAALQHPKELKAQIVAMPAAQKRYEEWQKNFTEPSRVPSGSAPVNLSAQDAANLLVWVAQQMRELPRTDSMRPPLQRLSQELGRLCNPVDRQSRQGEVPRRGHSVESSESAGTADEKPLDIPDQSLNNPIRKNPK